MKSTRLLAAAVAVLLLAIAPGRTALAQAVYGSLAGTVSDPSDAALPGVTVTATSLERRTVHTAVTNSDGLFLIERLLPGTYEVKAELGGFKAAVVSRAVVSVDTQTTVDFGLELGQLTEAVTITAAEGQRLKTDRADVATTQDAWMVRQATTLDRTYSR